MDGRDWKEYLEDCLVPSTHQKHRKKMRHDITKTIKRYCLTGFSGVFSCVCIPHHDLLKNVSGEECFLLTFYWHNYTLFVLICVYALSPGIARISVRICIEIFEENNVRTRESAWQMLPARYHIVRFTRFFSSVSNHDHVTPFRVYGVDVGARKKSVQYPCNVTMWNVLCVCMLYLCVL